MDQIRQRGISIPLPQAQSSRFYCEALALRARLQISRGQLDDAIETLQAGYAWSRNWRHGVTFVQGFIGMAIQEYLDAQTRTLIAADNSPNLYWALTDLAEQPIDLRKALSYESKLWEFTVHGISELDRRILSPEEALNLAMEIRDVAGRDPRNSAAVFLWAIQLESEARKYLLAHGNAADRLDAMPVLQMVLLYRWRQFEIVRDDYLKSSQLPDGEIREAISRSGDALQTAALRREGEPFTNLLPAVGASRDLRLRSMRHTNLLRTVEALRTYAAEHDRWPEKLDEIKAVPVPRDPYADRPFEYSLLNDLAILSPAPDFGKEYSGGSGAQRYELTLRKPRAK
jgi:hypothetical protein